MGGDYEIRIHWKRYFRGCARVVLNDEFKDDISMFLRNGLFHVPPLLSEENYSAKPFTYILLLYISHPIKYAPLWTCWHVITKLNLLLLVAYLCNV